MILRFLLGILIVCAILYMLPWIMFGVGMLFFLISQL